MATDELVVDRRALSCEIPVERWRAPTMLDEQTSFEKDALGASRRGPSMSQCSVVPDRTHGPVRLVWLSWILLATTVRLLHAKEPRFDQARASLAALCDMLERNLPRIMASGPPLSSKVRPMEADEAECTWQIERELIALVERSKSLLQIIAAAADPEGPSNSGSFEKLGEMHTELNDLLSTNSMIMAMSDRLRSNQFGSSH